LKKKREKEGKKKWGEGSSNRRSPEPEGLIPEKDLIILSKNRESNKKTGGGGGRSHPLR